MREKLEIKVGEEYQIYDDKAVKTQTSFEGFYIGKNPILTNHWSRIERPEGYTFIKRNGEGELEVYCNRSEKGLKLMWYSDGEDGPEWPAGFPVEKVDVKLSELEMEYLQSRFNAWRSLKTA